MSTYRRGTGNPSTGIEAAREKPPGKNIGVIVQSTTGQWFKVDDTDATITHVVNQLTQGSFRWLPVVDRERGVGMLRKDQIICVAWEHTQ